jgi:hypothetical protein
MKLSFGAHALGNAEIKNLFTASAALLFSATAAAGPAGPYTVEAYVVKIGSMTSGDAAEFAVWLRPVTVGDPNAPAANGCLYSPIYFGANGNPSAKHRTIQSTLLAAQLTSTKVTIYYTKGADTRCTLDRADVGDSYS